MKVFLYSLLFVMLYWTNALGGEGGKSCQAIPESQCGKNVGNCLKCGTASSYDCTKCCPGCTLYSKYGYSYCLCKKPPTPPGPPANSSDTWLQYEVAGLNVTAVVGGKQDPRNPKYEKVVIMLHGGGASGEEWVYNYEQGWFDGHLDGVKYVFPTSHIDSHVWYNSYKNGCGLADDCAYDIPSIQDSASRVSALILSEQELLNENDAKNIYLAGFSQGAQLASYVQISQINFALGGTIVMDGFPLPPLCDMPGADPAAAKRNATYTGHDMKFYIWHGSADPIFPVNLTMNAYDGIFAALQVPDVLKVSHIESGQSHTVIQKEFSSILQWISQG